MPSKIIKKIKTFLAAEDGPTIVEYAVMLALIAGMMITAMLYVGDQAQGTSNDVLNAMEEALNN